MSRGIVNAALSGSTCLARLALYVLQQGSGRIIFLVVLSSGLAKFFAALDGFDLFTVHNLRSYETAEPGFEPGASLGAKRERFPLCYAARPSTWKNT